MSALYHPKPRKFDSVELSPSVHWAQFINDSPSHGYLRRIYDFELMYVIRGEIKVHFGEASPPLLTQPGDLLLLPSAMHHRIELLTDPSVQLLGIHFDFFDELDILLDQDIIVKEEQVRNERFCYLPVNAEGEPMFARYYSGIPMEIVEWMRGIVDEFSSRNPGYEMACRGMLLQISTALMRLQLQPSRNIHPEYRKEIQALAEEMEVNRSQSWSNAAMARRINVSEDYFIRLFQDIIGMSPHKYLQFIRHREAKRLLQETHLKIEQIGRLLSYNDLHNFSHVFKKWQGISPREYRKLCRMF